MYQAELAVAPVEKDDRLSPRRLVNFAASLRDNGVTAQKVQAVDLSSGGCRLLNCVASVEPGAEVWLKITGRPALRAFVVWTKNGEIGCEFATPLEDQELTLRSAATAIKLPLQFGRR